MGPKPCLWVLYCTTVMVNHSHWAGNWVHVVVLHGVVFVDRCCVCIPIPWWGRAWLQAAWVPYCEGRVNCGVQRLSVRQCILPISLGYMQAVTLRRRGVYSMRRPRLCSAGVYPGWCVPTNTCSCITTNLCVSIDGVQGKCSPGPCVLLFVWRCSFGWCSTCAYPCACACGTESPPGHVAPAAARWLFLLVLVHCD